jgi:uncharacterized protein (TIGR02466 family)
MSNKPKIIGIEEKSANQLQSFFYFPSSIYTIDKPEFLPIAKEVSANYLKKRKQDQTQLNEIYPVYMTEHFFNDSRMAEFSRFVAVTAWNILLEQGYQMKDFETFFTEMWCQEHHKHSAQEQHIHGAGVQMVGCYFLETPKDCSKVIFHDPKAAKVQISLPETNMAMPTFASNMLNFNPEPGKMVFFNSWLPHSFTRHASEQPLKFIHFNLGVKPIAK